MNKIQPPRTRLIERERARHRETVKREEDKWPLLEYKKGSTTVS